MNACQGGINSVVISSTKKCLKLSSRMGQSWWRMRAQKCHISPINSGDKPKFPSWLLGHGDEVLPETSFMDFSGRF
jgi:hypothetical protein